MHFPRIVIAATHSGAGKTTVTLALMRLFAMRGHTVAPFKVGPDYIDPLFHNAALRNIILRGSTCREAPISRNLDPWLLSENTVRALFYRQALAAQPCETSEQTNRSLAVIEGVMGLYDGLGGTAFCSTAHVAALLDAPIVLALNAEGMALSAAALVQGFAGFAPDFSGPDAANGHSALPKPRVAGVICNRVSGPAHYAIIKDAVEKYAAVPCLGYIAKNTVPALPSRHLGLVPANEHALLEDYFHSLAAAGATLDLDAIETVAQSAPPLPKPECVPEIAFLAASARNQPGTAPAAAPAHNQANTAPTEASAYNANGTAPATAPASIQPGTVRIAIAKDDAFSFYYEDALALLTSLGATLVPFSPLHEAALPPDIHGLYLGGGYPEVFAKELEANASMRECIRSRLEAGLPAFAECGGMLYLCAGLSVSMPEKKATRRFQMVRFFDEEAAMTNKLQAPFGYVQAQLRHDCPLGRKGGRFNGHSFHYSTLVGGMSAPPLLHISKADGRAWLQGLCKKETAAWYPHLHFCGCPDVARAFVERCANFAARGASPHIKADAKADKKTKPRATAKKD